MKKLYLFFIFFAFFLSGQNLNAAGEKIKLAQDDIFQRIDTGVWVDYKKLEPSGCTTIISLRDDSQELFFSHDMRCVASPDDRENVDEIAKSISDMIEYFDLEGEIRSKSSVLINIGWRINNEALIRFVNDDKAWPKNIYTSIKEKYTNEEDRYNALKEIIKKEIDKSKVFIPFVAAMEKIGCIMTLKEDFVDGLFFDEHNITKDMLVEWGVFSKEEARKDEYPVLKGPIEFDLRKID